MRDQALRLARVPVPAPLSSSSRSSHPSRATSATPTQRAADAEKKQRQLEHKLAALQYYGLGTGMYDAAHQPWSAATMLGSEPVDFVDAKLAHIYPRSTADDVVDALGSQLRLPVLFLTEPRSFLILPPVVEVAYDREAILLLLANDGSICVTPWHLSRMTEAELHDLRPFLGRELTWPTKGGAAAPCLPFMRLLAWTMLSASRKQPNTAVPPYDDALRGMHGRLTLPAMRAAAKAASQSEEGNEGLGKLAAGLGFDEL